jgi:hypothetical protein
MLELFLKGAPGGGFFAKSTNVKFGGVPGDGFVHSNTSSLRKE